MEVWAGTIVSASDLLLRGVHLINTCSSGDCGLSKDVKLSLRSLVNPACIPLYSQTASHFEVHVRDTGTSAWLANQLLSNIAPDADESDELQTIQCPVGLLLGVEYPSGKKGRPEPATTTTHILVYGILSSPLNSKRPMTPPAPLPVAFQEQETQGSPIDKELRIYAAPMCSSLITKAQSLPSPPLSPSARSPSEDGPFAEFLPDLRSPSPKRKRVAALFDSAIQYHKKMKGKGGRVVSQLMARESSSSRCSQPSYVRSKKEEGHSGSSTSGNLASASQTRHALSITRITQSSKPLAAATSDVSRPETSRPRTLSLAGGRNIAATFGDDAASYKLQSCQQQHGAATPDTDIPSQNKALLTRTILTCMRLYGFHRNMRTIGQSSSTPCPPAASAGVSHGRGSVSDPETDLTMPLPAGNKTQVPNTTNTDTVAVLDADEDDDFKTMYHATYRASSFALRRYLKSASFPTLSESSTPTSTSISWQQVPILEKDRAMDLVDGVLKLFCEAEGL